MPTESEDQFCARVFQYIWNYYPETRGCLIHVANERDTNRVQGGRLKAKGVLPGVSDYIFLWKGRTYFIEAKTKKGTLSQKQKAFKHTVGGHGFPYFIVRSYDEFVNLIESIIFS